MSHGGYYRSPWPGEDGGPARLQVPRGPFAPLLGAGQRLHITRRRVHFPTMTVLREPGEVYLLRHQMLRHRFLRLPTGSRRTAACVPRCSCRASDLTTPS